MNYKVAVLSIATNGYADVFSDCINSHRLYCKREGYDYFIVDDSPPYGISASESSWMKIALMLKFLKSNSYEWVVFFDADCFIKANCPRVEIVDDNLNYAFFGNDHTGRINAGVIIIKNGTQSRCLLSSIRRSAWVPSRLIPRQCRNLYENGHVIWICSNRKGVGILDPRWNYSHGMFVEDEYVSHGVGRFFEKPRLRPDSEKLNRVVFSCIRPIIKPVVNDCLASYYWKRFQDRLTPTSMEKAPAFME